MRLKECCCDNETQSNRRRLSIAAAQPANPPRTLISRILRSSFHTRLRSLICHPTAHGAWGLLPLLLVLLLLLVEGS